MSVRTDAARIFLTAWLVYAAFWNPWLHSTMTWSVLDAAVTFVDTGRWELAHSALYGGVDAIPFPGRVLSSQTPGTVVLVTPFYVLWSTLFGRVGTPDEFQAFNGFLSLTVGAAASAFAAVQVAWLAGWLGATRRGQLWAAALFAFGTQNFVFGTMLFKEGLCAPVLLSAFRLAVEPGSLSRRVAAGFCAGVATALVYQAGLLVALLVFLVAQRDGRRHAAVFLVGCSPIIVALGLYHTWLFGAPWRTLYFEITSPHAGIVSPKVAILLDLLVGPQRGAGIFLYAPFLVMGLAGLVSAWRTSRRGEAAVVGVFLVGLWLAVAAWQSEFVDRAFSGITLGHRMMFPAIPLLAAFAGLSLENALPATRFLVAVPSVACGYLNAQAGYITGGAEQFPYAIKTWISGTGMGVFFKEALPAWLGLDTLHTVVSRPDVSAGDLLRLLPTAEGARLAGNQLLLLGANLLVLGGIAWFLLRLWQKEEKRIEQ